jgi:hypothetical protein
MGWAEEAKRTTRINMKWNLKKRFMLSDGTSTFITEKILPHCPDSRKFRELAVETTVKSVSRCVRSSGRIESHRD